MRMKKSALLLAIVMLLSSVFVGCSKQEIGMYDLMQEMNKVAMTKPVIATGTIQLDKLQIPDKMLRRMGEKQRNMLQAVLRIIEGSSIVTTAKQDFNKNIYMYTIALQEKNAEQQRELFTMQRKDKATYFTIGEEVWNVIQTVVPDMKQALAPLKEVKTIRLTDEELKAILSTEPSMKAFKQILRSPEEKMDLNNKVMKQIYELFTKAYKDFDFDLVKEQNHRYSVSMDITDIIALVDRIVVYTLDHADEILDAVSISVKEYTDEEFELLFPQFTKERVLKQLELLKKQIVKEEIAKMKDDWKKQVSMITVGLTEVMNGTKIEFEMYKEKNAYYSSIKESISISDPTQGTPLLSFEISVNKKMEEMKDGFEITVPTQIDTLLRLDSAIKQVQQEMGKLIQTLRIDVKSQRYEVEHSNIIDGSFTEGGMISVKTLDNASHLPLRSVAEILDKKVGWDAVASKAFIEQDGEKIYMDGRMIEGKVFVKVREFDKIGYTVKWDQETQVIILQTK